MIEPFGMVLPSQESGGGVVIDHIDHQAHAQAVNLAGQALEILHCAVFLVDGAIIPDGIRAPKRPFSACLSDGMNGQKPEEYPPQIPDARKVLPDLFKRALLLYCRTYTQYITCWRSALLVSQAMLPPPISCWFDFVFFAQHSFSCHQPLTAAEAMPSTNRF